ncbi:MAG: hypothetical protein GVY07_05745 [Bacteroidetes bacterium]|nr:hypothetical protein [Bacteroidota bacterium]
MKNINGLYHIDYSVQVFNGFKKPDRELDFKKTGFIYGPIRVSSDLNAPVGRSVIKPMIQPEFIRDKIALFLVRDPRDILVSSYYSFGFTHSLSNVEEVREHQLEVRKSVKEKSLDEYVLSEADTQVKYFKKMYELTETCKRDTILRYEDMIHNFDDFAEKLCEYVSIEDTVLEGLYQRSRPKQSEDALSHRRSGRVGGFRDKLQKATIQAVNKKMIGILTLFGYEA